MPVGPTPGIAAAAVAGGDTTPRHALRQALLERRRALSSAALEHHSARIRLLLQGAFPHFAGQRIGFCWPVNNEPDLRPLIARWASEGQPGFRALLPVVLADRQGLAFRAWSPGVAMCPDCYGIPTPATGEFLIPQALLIPVNGFDAAGYRIGYGGGYFDRALAALCPRPLAVGVGFELARLESIDPAPHDQPLDVMVTEAGVFWPSP